jgi:hypothetical protein
MDANHIFIGTGEQKIGRRGGWHTDEKSPGFLTYYKSFDFFEYNEIKKS